MPLKKFKAKLIPELKELNLYVKKNLMSTTFSGELASSIKGGGIEFEDYRDYTTFDDASRIDWRASKRSQRLLLREYKLEINFSVFFLVDVSESMLFSSTPKLKCEYAAEVVTSLFYGILQTGNSTGFALFNDKLIKVAEPLLGKKQFYTFTREIADPKSYGGEKDFGRAIQQLMSILDRKSMIFIVSDFLGMKENWIEYFKILAKKHEVIGIMINDPRDLTIPETSGQFIFQDPFSEDNIYIDSKQYSKIYNEYNLKQLLLIDALFKENRSSILHLTTDKHFMNPMLQFFRKRGGRWR